MNLFTISCVLVLCVLTGLHNTVHAAENDNYPAVIELVGYNNRRARTQYIPPEDTQSKTKMAADIETVKQNIEKYNKLLKVDTKNLPESQKEILERIVERVARLKESLDNSQNKDNITNSDETMSEPTESQDTTIPDSQTISADLSALSSASPSSSSSSVEETTNDPDTVTTVDAQSMMSTAEEEDYLMSNQDVSVDDDASAKEIPYDEENISNTDRSVVTVDQDESETASIDDNNNDEEIPTSTIGSGEIDDDQFVAARSNNNNHRTLVSTSNSVGKTKSRPISTKRPVPSSSTKSSSSTSTIKRINGQKPSSMVGSKPTTTYIAGSSSITTIQPTVKIPKPVSQQKETETLMKVQHQLPQKQQAQFNKLNNYQQEQDSVSKLAAIPQQQQQPAQQQQQIEHKTLSPIQQAVQIEQRTPILASSISSTNTAGSGLGSDMLYDSNVNTSSIIDSLNSAREEFYNKAGINSKDKKPSATAKPTKYHYYPHNQHIYLLPECAIQQVCNAVYVRLNYTQPLCACPSRYRDPCSASLNEDDQHTTKLVGDNKKKAITLAKTCEATTEMRECRTPKDWSLLALQNTRTGKSHYLVICRCPDHFKMEGPMAHDQPTYASVPGIRVFGMMCVKPGYSVRKPSAQPPKRYQLQKPYYIPNSQNKYGSIKDHSRPSYSSSPSSSLSGSSYQTQHHHSPYQQDSFQNQYQSNYQYLNRPDSSSSSHYLSSSSNSHGHNSHNIHNDYPESLSFSGSIYGRNNERNGEKPIPATDEDSTSSSSSSSTSSSSSSNSSPNSSSSSPIAITTKTEDLSRITADGDSSPPTLEKVTSKRDKRSLPELDDDADDIGTPEFPWQRAIEFQRSIVWD